MDLQALYNDVRQRYEGTYVRLESPSTGNVQVFYVEKVAPGEPYPTMLLRNDTSGGVQVKYDSSVRIRLQSPESGYFTFEDKYAYVFQRWMGRQWKRTVCSGNSRIANPYRDILPGLAKGTGLTTALVTAAYEAKRYTFKDALEKLERKEALSLPVSQYMAIGLNPTKATSYVLWFLQTPIAEIFASGTAIRLHESHFNQEVVDFCKKENLYAKIV